MSEYQYYEFQAVDRRLDEKEMRELRSYSTRANITPTSFTNEYQFGNFKGNPDSWMEKYFDGYLYLANWGTHELQIRLPAKLLSRDMALLYCPGQAASVREKAGNLIFTFCSEEEGGEWVEGNGILASLLSIRADLARGDLRALYLGWLLCAQDGGLDDDAIEPPVPANLGKLTGALSSFVDFLRVDPDLVSAAAQASCSVEVPSMARGEMAAWVASLPAKEKNDILIQIMKGEDAHVGADLCSRFSRQRTPTHPMAHSPRRTVGELLGAAQAPEQERLVDQNRKAARGKIPNRKRPRQAI